MNTKSAKNKISPEPTKEIPLSKSPKNSSIFNALIRTQKDTSGGEEAEIRWRVPSFDSRQGSRISVALTYRRSVSRRSYRRRLSEHPSLLLLHPHKPTIYLSSRCFRPQPLLWAWPMSSLMGFGPIPNHARTLAAVAITDFFEPMSYSSKSFFRHRPHQFPHIWRNHFHHLLDCL